MRPCSFSQMAETAITSEDSRAQTQSPGPAVFLHGAGAVSPERMAALGERDMPVFCHAALEGARRTATGLDAFGALCAELAEKAPGRGLLVLDRALAPSDTALDALSALLAQRRGVAVYTTSGNADPGCNPFAGLDTGATDTATRERLVALLGSGRLLPLSHWPRHLLALGPETIAALADPALAWKDVPARLRTLQATVTLADWIHVEAPGAVPDAEPRLEPHEERRPTPWGPLSERLQDWLSALTANPSLADDLPGPEAVPATLHVTHSWGGGVAAWVASMIDGDPAGRHFQLRSEGPQTGQGAGQRLALYLGNHLETPVDQWWLQAPIRAVEAQHTQYGEVLDAVCDRLGVGRVIVSSLVGHSLDALRSDRPTMQVLHDAFPAWPLLSIHPDEYGADLEAALADRRAGEQFPEFNLEDWRRIGDAYAEAARQVRRVAPSQSALDVQARVEPGLAPSSIAIIPHGLPALPRATISLKARTDGRLRVVIPGRVQSGKGAALLEQALPALRDVAHVTLLGTGKGGERFFGMGGVNVVPQYDRAELPGLLAALGPDCAVLPSVVPETFSYTLSEMFALGVPVVATRLGSFAERIEDGVTGWLVDPTPDALVAQLRALSGDAEALAGVRERLADFELRSLEAMVADYERLCPPARAAARRPALPDEAFGLVDAQAAARADRLRRARSALGAAADRERNLRAQVDQRTRWAEDEQRRSEQLRDERDLATARGDALDEELSERARHITALDQKIIERDRHILDTERRLGEARAQATAEEEHRHALQAALEQVWSSHSWKLTRPLRAGRRVAGNLVRLKAWNPMRWPLLLSQGVRLLATDGTGQALRRLQHAPPGPAPAGADRPREPVAEPVEVQLPDRIPCAAEPLVSIVIPAYRHLEHTAACLASIAAAKVSSPFEVIVVDDASGDGSPERLATVDGLVLRVNEENRGFIHTCNRGAEDARGEFVLFLNNDTQVGDGWLDALLETFAQRPDAGLVGARLVYPDGTLQECGGMVFSDGSGWNYGRGDDPDRPEYQSLREVDYCSGACLVLRRDLFASLGGFDAHYAPAYYEDTDLAFRVREQGLKVYVQPRATVVHFEGVSSGTDLESGTKRYQVVNREKFLARWSEALSRQPAPIEDPQDTAAVRAARDHRLAGRVLVVDAYTPEPDQDSGSVRLVNLMRCLLELGYGVSFFADNRAWGGRYTRDLQALGIEAWYDPWMESAEAFLERQADAFSHVIVSRHYIAVNHLETVRRLAPDAKFIFDTVDLHYLREQRLAELEDSTALRQVAKQTRRSELAMIRAADATLVVSPVEQELLAKEAPGADVHILSNIHEVNGSAAGFGERSDLYFVGGYQHPPNIDAARWFVESIWPLVRERLPEVRFHLVGSKATDEVRALGEAEGVTFHGFVERLDPFLDRCRLSVAPLRYGAGVKGKVNQAMAHGQPVVATPAAVEGLNAVDGQDVLVAEDAASFADAVVRLYGDEALWNRLSENGLENVHRHFSREAARRDLAALLDALGG